MDRGVDAAERPNVGALVTSVALSVLVIAAMIFGWSALIGALFLLAWIPGGFVAWFLLPVFLTALAVLAAFFAVRSRRSVPRIFAGAALVCALATFAVPMHAQIIFAGSFS